MRSVFAILAMALALAGCSSLPVIPPKASNSPYLLDTGDKVRVIVYSDTTLSQEYAIGDNGTLVMPLIGEVPARGVTVQALQEQIQQQLRQGVYKNPGLSVEITQYRPIYVVGEVTKPGAFPFAKDLTVLSAVSLAGGYTIRANRDEMSVFRKFAGVKKEYSAVPLSDLAPGDVLVVHEQFF